MKRGIGAIVKPSGFDYVVLIVLVAAVLFESLWYWPRCVRAIRAGVPGARGRLYRGEIIVLWAVTLCVLALWIAKARPWSALWLGSAVPWRLGIGFFVAAIIVALLLLQARKVQKALARPKAVASLRDQFSFADPLVPRTSGERRGFWLLSITAGICEEILFRGFLMWLIAAWTDLALAVIISSVLFGCVHIYLGKAHVPKTAIAGLLFALVVFASGSLWPAIVIHAAIDLNAGEIGFRVGQAAGTPPEAALPLTN
jgi:uncharacterized protein